MLPYKVFIGSRSIGCGYARQLGIRGRLRHLLDCIKILMPLVSSEPRSMLSTTLSDVPFTMCGLLRIACESPRPEVPPMDAWTETWR